jgi:anti-sigma factor RsiW
MKNCADVQATLPLYVDGEMAGGEVLALEAHLTECRECRRAYDGVRSAVDAVRGAGAIYEAPEGSYEAAQRMVGSWERRRKWRRVAPVAAAVVVVLAAALGWMASSGADYETFAARAHRSYARGTFPLDVTSREPAVVSEWLGPRVPFHLTLPNYPEGGPKRYSLKGARIMQYRGEDVAYLAYEMDQKPISLLISSSPRIVPAGGEVYRSGGLSFYFTSEEGFRIISWKDKGLIYAQVSDLNVNGAESCAICHGAENERRKFEHLRQRL